jgi:hypothetical protein
VGGETTLSGVDGFAFNLSYAVNGEQLFVNGVLLERGVDYTATSGTSVTLSNALVVGDLVTIISQNTFAIANAVSPSLVTAKGDLLVGTGSSTVTNLAVGADGTTLVANSSASTGVSWSAGNALANPIINSGMDIWQRGTSFSSGASPIYTADRWDFNRAGGDTNATVARQATGDTTNLPNIQYAARVQRTNGTSATTSINLWQSLETVNSIPFAGKTVTFSFYARAGANYSSASNALSANFYTGTGTDQNINVTGYTGQSNFSNTATLTTTWQRFSYQIAVPATTTEIGIIFTSNPTGTAGANDYFDLTGVQLDLGTVALPYRRNGSTYEAELAACQRYFYAVNDSRVALGFYYVSGSVAYAEIKLSVTMRTSPSVTSNPTLSYYTFFAVGSAMGLSTAPALDNGGPNNVLVGFTASAGTAGQTGVLGVTDSRGYIWFSAEL